jgi:hypothetical protein
MRCLYAAVVAVLLLVDFAGVWELGRIGAELKALESSCAAHVRTKHGCSCKDCDCCPGCCKGK